MIDQVKSLRTKQDHKTAPPQDERIVAREENSHDEWQSSLRPKTLADYVGQEDLRRNLSVYIEAAKKRSEALDHVLLYGPPGLGKTTMASIIANELGVNFRITSGPAIERPGDLAALLTNLEAHDVLFIDEIHRLSAVWRKSCIRPLEDFSLDILSREGTGDTVLPSGSSAVYTDRRNNQSRVSGGSAAGPFRDCFPDAVLPYGGTAVYYYTGGEGSSYRD